MKGSDSYMTKEQIFDLLEDLLQECFNDLYEYEHINIEKADLIYSQIKLFTLKMKDKIEDLL